ncbi:MAG: GAF domain-containing protein, partial [Chloroflexi bacterium]|nr:GAF domain-containing protein [Chloroflexota bacterium]
VLAQIVDLTSSVVHSDYTSVVLVDARDQPELGAEDFRGVPPIVRRIRDRGVTRQVLDSGQPLVADTISADGMISSPFPGAAGELLLANPAIVAAGIRSFAAVPIRVKEKMLGVLFVHSRETGAFHGQLPLLITFANQIAVAIENARLFAAERRARQLSDILSEVVRELNAAPDLDTALDLVLSYMERVIAFDSGSVLLLEGGQMNVAAVRGFAHPERVLGAQLDLDIALLNREVIETRRPLIVGAVADDPRWRESMDTSGLHPDLERIHSWIGVPLLIQDRVIGMLTADKAEPDFYRRPDAELALVFAGHAAVVIEKARLLQAEREQRELAEALREAAAAVSSTLDLDQVLDHILEQVQRVIPGDAVNFMLVEGDVARIVRWRGYAQFDAVDHIRSVSYRVSDTPTLRQMLETGAPRIIPDTAADPGWVPEPAMAWLRSYAGMPIPVRDQVIGFLNVDSATAGFFHPAHLDHLRIFAGHASLALENARQYQAEQRRASEALAISAITQALNASTGLAAVCQAAERELRRVVSFDRLTLALLSADRQHFTMFALADQEAMPLGSGVTMPLAASAATEDVLAGQPHLTPDLAAELDYPAERILYDAGLRSRLNLPLLLGQTVIGALNLASCQPQAFGPQQLPLLGQVTAAVAAAVQNAQLFDETRRRAAHLAALNAVITAAIAAPNLAELLAAALEHTLHALGLEMGSIWMADRHTLRGITPETHTAIIEAIQTNGLELAGAVAVADWQEPI